MPKNPATIALFSIAFIDRMRRGYDGTNDWLKAMGAVLRYRADATSLIPIADCEEITRHALCIFESELDAHNTQYRFRNACLIIVYLLRKRAYEDTYLDPVSPLAKKSKRAFIRAIDAHDRGDIMLISGTVRLRPALEMMVKYIDRHGHGKFLLGV